jgi:general secretion pathway protein D
VGIVLAPSACNGLSEPAKEPVPQIGGSPPEPVTAVPMDLRGPSGPVAAIRTDRPREPAIAPIVVYGRDQPTTPPLPAQTVAANTGKPGDVTLNFAGAEIRDVVAEVLGQALKLNYVIDPEVTGPVTFNVSRPIRRDEILPTLETVLNSRGATMVQANGMVRVMPMHKDAKAGVAAPTAAPASSTPAPIAGVNSEVFPLRFVSATDMQHVLQKMLPAVHQVSPDEARRSVVVQGSPSELQVVRDAIRVLDVDQLSGMSMALVPLRNADPAVVANELKSIFATTRKEADTGAIRFMSIARLNAVMVITRSVPYLEEARAWIARLDRSRNVNERKVYVYNLQYSKAVQVGQKLQGLLTGLDIQFKPPASAAAPADPLTAPTGGETGRLVSAAKSPEIKLPAGDAAMAAVLTAPHPAGLASEPHTADRGAVRIEADEAQNALLISASPRDYDLVRQVLEGIDVPPLQVLIQVTVAEVALNDKLNYGVEYFINSGRTNVLLTTRSIPTGIVPNAPGFALSWVPGNFEPRAILEALSEVTETRVISTPRLLVLSNQTARLQVGDVVPIITQSATSTVTNNPLVLNNVTYKETGVVLEVTPRVNSGGFVTMDVNQSVSDVINTTTSNIDSPTIRQRRLASTISVRTGESILLGGLIQQQNSQANSGIPVLNELPGIGSLFGTRRNGAARTELIMLMTPHVIANDDAARYLTARVEREFGAVLDANAIARPRRPSR